MILKFSENNNVIITLSEILFVLIQNLDLKRFNINIWSHIFALDIKLVLHVIQITDITSNKIHTFLFVIL